MAQLRGLKAVGLADTRVTDSGLTLLLTRFPDLEAVGLSGAEGLTQTGTVLPSAALIRHEGEVFVYVQDGPETFRRKPVELARPEENGWFVRGGVRPGEAVVIVGAQQMLSEELKSKGGEE